MCKVQERAVDTLRDDFTATLQATAELYIIRIDPRIDPHTDPSRSVHRSICTDLRSLPGQRSGKERADRFIESGDKNSPGGILNLVYMSL